MLTGLGRALRRNRTLVALVRRLSLPDYIEPLRRMGYQGHTVEKAVRGLRFQMWIDNPVSEEWYERSAVSSISEFFVDELLGEGDVVVDAGAHNGYYTLLSSLRVGAEGRVHAFEALPSNYGTLSRNLEMNDVANVQAYNLAVGGHRGQVRFNSYNDGMMSDHGRLVVEMVPIGDVVDGSVDVLKVDVEGAECEVLDGAQAVIGPGTRILCEVHPEQLGHFGRSTQDVVERLRGFGGVVRYWDDGVLRPVEEHMDDIRNRKSFVFRLPEDWPV